MCWPWRLRQFHMSINEDVESSTILGVFGDGSSSSSLEKRPVTFRADGRRNELIATLEGGDSCSNLQHKWSLSLADAGIGRSTAQWEVHGVGGSFNPAAIANVQGILEHDVANVDGCGTYGGRLDGGVVLVKRGNCFFHKKALMAQAAGAAAVVVYNDQQQTVDIMEGVEELASPRIPTVLIPSSALPRLKAAMHQRFALGKVSEDGLDLNRSISSTVVFRCGSAWRERVSACVIGSEVDVKVYSLPENGAETSWPQSSVRFLRATIEEFFPDNGTIRVSWLPMPEGEDAGGVPSDDIVPADLAFSQGTPCDSEPGAYAEELAEPQQCQSELVVHVAALCADPRFVPSLIHEPHVIGCTHHGGNYHSPDGATPIEPTDVDAGEPSAAREEL